MGMTCEEAIMELSEVVKKDYLPSAAHYLCRMYLGSFYSLLQVYKIRAQMSRR